MHRPSGGDGERPHQVLSCEVRASDEVASICQEAREDDGKIENLLRTFGNFALCAW